eukprot:Lankesteria_metandrocarpae@DN1083_c0_g1_i1.p1
MNKPNFAQARANRRHASIVQFQQRRRAAHNKLLSPTKGLAVHFGHESWNMMLNMMVGIRLASARLSSEPRRQIGPYDFVMKEKFSIMPQTYGLYDSVGKQRVKYEGVRFIDYAPIAFRKIRESFGIKHEEYVKSVGPEQLVGNMVLGNLASLSELCSEGKSGAYFYYTSDGKFMIKTMTKATAKFFRSILRSYYEHVIALPDTLLTRFFGFHAMRHLRPGRTASEKLYFVIMGNFFHTPVEMHRRYDLKGSYVGRVTPAEVRSDPSVTLKDRDMIVMGDFLNIGKDRKNKLLATLQADSKFCDSQLILDYSLLVGIHWHSPSIKAVPNNVHHTTTTTTATQQHPTPSPYGAGPSRNFFTDGGPGPVDQPIWMLDSPGSILSNPPDATSLPFHQQDMGGMLSKDGTCLYYMGIIDVLTRWTTVKKLEHRVKSLRMDDSQGVSCIHPAIYAKRFVTFLESRVK